MTWQGNRNVSVEDVPDLTIQQPTDAIIPVTTTNICGSDLHLYERLGAFMSEGDILGHESIGMVEEVGSAVTTLSAGDRVVIPFQMSCGHCFMCDPLGVDDFATHRLPLEDAPHAYEIFQRKQDGAVKVLLKP